jgi:3-oxoacyl-[acyl-carrier protein] reductase
MENKELEGRVSLVTGASGGIGRAVALKLAALGSKVALNYWQHQETAQQVAHEIESFGGETFLIKADVRDSVSVKAMMHAVRDKWDSIDILINNAGILRNELLLRLPEESWDEVIDVNLKGAYLCSKFALLSMMDQNWGRIINISSVAAIRGNIGQTNYSAAKGGLISFTRSLAREVGSRNITVNAIAPGMIETDMMDTIPEKYKQDIMLRLAIPRAGKPEEVAELAGFLAGEHAAYITAQVINVDGGLI